MNCILYLSFFISISYNLYPTICILYLSISYVSYLFLMFFILHLVSYIIYLICDILCLLVKHIRKSILSVSACILLMFVSIYWSMHCLTNNDTTQTYTARSKRQYSTKTLTLLSVAYFVEIFYSGNPSPTFDSVYVCVCHVCPLNGCDALIGQLITRQLYSHNQR